MDNAQHYRAGLLREGRAAAQLIPQADQDVLLNHPEELFYGSRSGTQAWDTWDAIRFLYQQRPIHYRLSPAEQAKVLLGGCRSRMPVRALETFPSTALIDIQLSFPVHQWHAPAIVLETALVYAAFEQQDGASGLGFIALELFGTQESKAFRVHHQYVVANRDTHPEFTVGQLCSENADSWAIYALNAALTAAGLLARNTANTAKIGVQDTSP